MNKKIQELYIQAYGYFPCPAGEPETERFAELIVREWIDVLVDVLPDIVPEAKDGIHPTRHIQKHFGVK